MVIATSVRKVVKMSIQFRMFLVNVGSGLVFGVVYVVGGVSDWKNGSGILWVYFVMAMTIASDVVKAMSAGALMSVRYVKKSMFSVSEMIMLVGEPIRRPMESVFAAMNCERRMSFIFLMFDWRQISMIIGVRTMITISFEVKYVATEVNMNVYMISRFVFPSA